MKKKFLFSVILIPLCCLFSVHSVSAQTAPPRKPPLLIQQGQQPTPLPPATAPVPVPPLTPCPIPAAPAPGEPGIPVVRAIPVTALLRNLPEAITTARTLNRLLRPGKVWMSRGPSGELEIKAGILYQGIAIGILRINPENGSVLPLGIIPGQSENTVRIQSVKTALQSVFARLKVLPCAEFIEPESCWSFPLALDGRIVAHVKIYFDGIHVVQDIAANHEMLFYGR